MVSSIDEKLDRGRAVWEMTQTEGWQIIKSLIDQELEIESKDLLDCPIEEDLEHKQMIKAYRKVLSMVDSVIKERDETAQDLRKE
ncbi:MAG: hypothetical protein UX85_C0009G0032 [Candidatus Beckwithbacteria bacterium GW2011_GWB1_47_15]|uniref:Uncharacterized protein n=1 Tax=Candidatus Beckwithbacteria bacterium GW2011_GWB1_47_15 TaxID=1618371 RepID=A0A0G1RTD2_9BACT|nr:MAG: hypothetical protein UW18_C0003G0032 [Microgenomates group bacterium GW2011_GWF1_44_10]KKU02427.1 MAG: hypothetical protein UX04_C0001G0198 [Microgenomates group bacterium GW2011_GWF2_45_18]KKU60579.1 MAG: hypothetical protein UX85_C0009G0032 [Candidatus Beckwithbacteria bacterium GW2011_GWB1_47_15]KKU71284.1 MAG: hypothetical protein UX97_C0009G0005 [Candidatus Beckwithbacteria bacterium GW2011_GWA2_47_25]HAU99106.1 hypothetical protein [Candidatus Paceibacterota bacterium]